MKLIQKLFNSLGYQLVSTKKQIPVDIRSDVEFLELYKTCQSFTMTSIERMFALYHAVRYVVQNDIKGDFVECGVWKGGSSMMMAKTLMLLGDHSRSLYLYDTYEGMSEPSEADKDSSGREAKELLDASDKFDTQSVWCYSTLDEVQSNINSTGYPMTKIHFIKGKVEQTIPGSIPQQIALLRLDTDWYESTKHELSYLYPILSSRGVLIIDDYGYWVGARKAVDEYFEKNSIKAFLQRIDETGRAMIKG